MTDWDRRHPDFDGGNTVALRHGAYSTRVVEPLAARFVAELEASEPSWVEAVDRAAVDAWAVAEARAVTLRAWIDEHGLLDSAGKPTPAAELLLRVERVAAEMRSRLGLDPLSRGRLGRDVAVAHAVADAAVRSTAEAGRRIREQREAGQ